SNFISFPTSASGTSGPHLFSPCSTQDALGVTRGLILSTTPYLRSCIAIPKITSTPACAGNGPDIVNNPLFYDSLTGSDHSSTSSCSDDTLTTPHDRAQRLLDVNDLFSPHGHADPMITPPSKLVGLGISGVPRQDGKPGYLDGLGLVGIDIGVHRFHPTNPFFLPDEDDEDDQGYISPSPCRVYRRAQDDRGGRSRLDQDKNENDNVFQRPSYPRAVVYVGGGPSACEVIVYNSGA
ncbi:hypothetical protein H0H93_006822, partial [Arthromyces matolae]